MAFGPRRNLRTLLENLTKDYDTDVKSLVSYIQHLEDQLTVVAKQARRSPYEIKVQGFYPEPKPNPLELSGWWPRAYQYNPDHMHLNLEGNIRAAQAFKGEDSDE